MDADSTKTEKQKVSSHLHWKFRGCWYTLKSYLLKTLKGASTIKGIHDRALLMVPAPLKLCALI